MHMLQGGASCAVTAKGWEWAQAQHNLLLEQVLLEQTGVWARMGPANKEALVHRMAGPHPCSPTPSAMQGRKDMPNIKPAALEASKPSALASIQPGAPRASAQGRLPAWGLGAQVAFCGDGPNDAGALKVCCIMRFASVTGVQENACQSTTESQSLPCRFACSMLWKDLLFDAMLLPRSWLHETSTQS